MNRLERYIWIKIKTDNYNRLIAKMQKCDIYFYDSKVNPKYVLLKVSEKDYNRLKKYLISYKISILDESGIFRLKKIIKNNIFFIISLLVGIFLLLIINNLVIKIEIKSNELDTKKIVSDSLNKYNLKVLRFKKSHKQIENIVEKILNENKEYLEWLEIRYDGLNMIVEVTEKVKQDEIIENDICNIVAKSDAKIISYSIKKGEPIISLNQYVYKDEVLVTGIIKHNEEIKDTICADAEVYGEMWYKVNIEVPLETEEYVKTGKKKYNFSVVINDNKYKILRSRFKKYHEKNTNLYKLNDFRIDLVKEEEQVLQTNKLSEKEAYEKGLKLVEEKIKLKLKDNEEILEKKVLKNTINDSTIVLEVFVVTKENIAKQMPVKEVELDDQNGTIESVR